MFGTRTTTSEVRVGQRVARHDGETLGMVCALAADPSTASVVSMLVQPCAVDEPARLVPVELVAVEAGEVRLARSVVSLAGFPAVGPPRATATLVLCDERGRTSGVLVDASEAGVFGLVSTVLSGPVLHLAAPRVDVRSAA